MGARLAELLHQTYLSKVVVAVALAASSSAIPAASAAVALTATASAIIAKGNEDKKNGENT